MNALSLASSVRPAAPSASVAVFCSGACYVVMQELIPGFERLSGHRIDLASASSMGTSATAIPARLRRGEPADVLIMAGIELDRLIAEGLAVEGSRVDVVRSLIGMAVKDGACVPDISTAEAFEKVLMDAKSIGYSASASGQYLASEGFARLGEPRFRQVMAKAKEVVGDRVGTWLARGDLEIGFQQVSELLPIPGSRFVGAIPAPYQRVTVFSAGVAASSVNREAGQALIRYLTSPAAFPIIRKYGMEPAAEPNA
jgi:molybdate transport system substrate-binding protein